MAGSRGLPHGPAWSKVRAAPKTLPVSDATKQRYRTFAWGFLAYTVAVILWGAFVRATGSGAGCGDHWPLCNGVVLPRSPAVETMIELTHRVTSGLSWLLAFVGVVFARRAYPRGHRVRHGAGWTLVFMSTEGLVGAALVLRQMVAENASHERGFWMAAHLLNTFLLLAVMTLTAFFASGGSAPRPRRAGPALPLVAAALVGVLFLGMSGAITALGDTLFPASSLAEGLADDLAPGAHLFVRLRVFHPLIGLAVGAVLLVTAGYLAGTHAERSVRVLAGVVVALFVSQVGLGFLNVALLAPVWLQLLHLFFADAIWIALVLLGARVLARDLTEPALRASSAQLDTDVVH
jgi:heme A synthase